MGRNIGKNLSTKFSQKLLNHSKQSATEVRTKNIGSNGRFDW